MSATSELSSPVSVRPVEDLADKPITVAVSASVVTYNNEPEELRSLLRSFIGVSISMKVTVIDNSDTDALRVVAQEFGVYYIKTSKNIGFGPAHNISLKLMRNRAKYHLVVNPDVTFDPSRICLLYRFMEENPNVGQLMPRVVYPNGEEQFVCKRLPTPFDLVLRRFFGRAGKALFPGHWSRYELHHLDPGVAHRIPNLSGCFMFLRASVMREVGGFDERYFLYMEDLDLCRRIAQVAETVFLPQVAVTHRYGKGSYKSLRLLMFHLNSALRYFTKWGWFVDHERDHLNANLGVFPTSAPLPSSSSLRFRMR